MQKLKEVIKGITYDIKRVDKAIEEGDNFIGRPEILALDKALARRYQHKLARHRRVLENRLHRRKEIVKGGGLSLDIAPDEEFVMKPLWYLGFILVLECFSMFIFQDLRAFQQLEFNYII